MSRRRRKIVTGVVVTGLFATTMAPAATAATADPVQTAIRELVPGGSPGAVAHLRRTGVT